MYGLQLTPSLCLGIKHRIERKFGVQWHDGVSTPYGGQGDDNLVFEFHLGQSVLLRRITE
jgi:hypothetical protein